MVAGLLIVIAVIMLDVMVVVSPIVIVVIMPDVLRDTTALTHINYKYTIQNTLYIHYYIMFSH